jgi:hypothetical protein
MKKYVIAYLLIAKFGEWFGSHAMIGPFLLTVVSVPVAYLLQKV